MERDSISRTLRRFSNMRYLLVLEGIGVGAAAGLVTVLFRAVLSQGETVLHAALAFGTAHPYFIPLWFVILLGAAGLVTYLLKWEPLISGSGIPQVEGEMQGRIRTVWWRVLLAKFLGGLLTIGAGLALGREGPSIQLGAMAGKGVSRLTKRVRTEEKLLMTCGASAGLAAAFNAPLAGVLFSLEELHKNFSLDVLLPAMASSITADVISRYIFGLKPVFDFSGIAMMPLKNYWLVPVLGLFLGKKPPKTTVFSVALAVVGLYLLSCMGVSRINKGDLYLMGCALAFSVQITCIDRLAGNLDGLRMNCIQALVVTVLSVPFILLTKETVVFSDITACWFPLVFSGVLSMGVAYTLQIVGQQGLEPTTASLIMSLESVFAALGGWLILHNTMTPSELTGCTLVFAGVIVSQVPVHKLFARK